MINEILKDNKISYFDIDALSIGIGPGSFTGIKIATSVIQGLSIGWKLPIIEISSLLTLALEAYIIHKEKFIFVSIDAKMNEVYYNTYSSINFKNASVIEKIKNINEIKIKNLETICVGDGCYKYRNILLENNKGIKIIENIKYPKASYNNKLAIEKFKNNNIANPIILIPKYIKKNTYKTKKNKN